MRNKPSSVGRVIGVDSHPDSFTAAVLRGETPAQAFVEKTFHKVPISQLQSWAKKHTQSDDLLVLEASGNSFQVVRTLRAIRVSICWRPWLRRRFCRSGDHRAKNPSTD